MSSQARRAMASASAFATAVVAIDDAAAVTDAAADVAPTAPNLTEQRMATIVFRREREPVLKSSKPLLLPGRPPLSPPQEQLTEWLRDEWNQLTHEQKLPYEHAAAAWTAERVPAKQPRPQRSSYDSGQSFAAALKEHEENMQLRRKAQERIREAARPKRDRRPNANHLTFDRTQFREQ